jgi:Protein of unknown function (DUF2795)
MPRELGGSAPAVVAEWLEQVDFPARKEDLIEHARRYQADKDVMNVLDRLPQGEYSSIADLRRAVGKAVESLHTPQATSSRKTAAD